MALFPLLRSKSRQQLSSSPSPSPSFPTPARTPLPSPSTNDFKVPLAVSTGDALTPCQPVPVQLASPLSRNPSSRQKVRAATGEVGGFHRPSAYSGSERSTPIQGAVGMGRSVSEGALPSGRVSSSSRYSSDLPPPVPLPVYTAPPVSYISHPAAPNGRRTIASLYPSPSSSSPSSAGMAQSRSLPTFPSTGSPYSNSTPQSAASPSPRRARKQPPSYTILVAGLASQTGKKSFIRALETLLVSASAGRSEQSVDEAGVMCSSRDILCPSSSSPGGKKKILHLTLLTAPSPSPSVPYASHPTLATSAACDAHVSSLLRLLEARFESTLQGELSFERRGGIKGKEDTHVHVCLWLVGPETLRGAGAGGGKTGKGGFRLAEEDEKAISRLSRRVLVVPILAKSDTLTLTQLALSKTALLSSRASTSLSAAFPSFASASMDLFLGRSGNSTSSSSSSQGSFSPEPSSPARLTFAEDAEATPTSNATLRPPKTAVVHLKRSNSRQATRRRRTISNGTDDPEETDEEQHWTVDRLREVWPFAIVGAEFHSQGEENQEGKLTREYRHGSVDLLNTAHCDFLPLFHSLFESERMERLKSFTRLSCYEPYRTEKLLALQEQQRREREREGTRPVQRR